jgi:hypothetical protein
MEIKFFLANLDSCVSNLVEMEGPQQIFCFGCAF